MRRSVDAACRFAGATSNNNVLECRALHALLAMPKPATRGHLPAVITADTSSLIRAAVGADRKLSQFCR
jgi:hypothetical protein